MWAYHWNTLEAYEEALKHPWIMGVCGDVQWTSDGEFVMFHDGEVSIHTDGTGTINSKTYAQVQALNVTHGVYDRRTNSWKGKQDGSTAKIPTFDEYLDLCRMYGKIAIIEMKCASGAGTLDNFGAANVDAIAEKIYDRNMQDSVAFMVTSTIVNYMLDKYPDLFQWVSIDSSWTQATIDRYLRPNCTVASYIDTISGNKELLKYTHHKRKLVWGYAARSATGDYIQRGIDLGLDAISIFSEPTEEQKALASNT